MRREHDTTSFDKVRSRSELIGRRIATRRVDIGLLPMPAALPGLEAALSG